MVTNVLYLISKVILIQCVNDLIVLAAYRCGQCVIKESYDTDSELHNG